MDALPIHGRGTAANPWSRFETLSVEPAPPDGLAAASGPETRYLRARSRSVLTRNDSPDVGFDVSLNPYRGCEHGCVYCYARPTHEYLGFSAGLDFESRILVKENAADLFRSELTAPSWCPRTIAMTGVTDPYQPVERSLGITRDCLEVLAEARQPVSIVTKSRLVLRDRDLLTELADRGARHAGYVPLRLPHGVSELFEAWLERHAPDRKEKVLNRIRSMRGGRLNDPRFGTRMKGEGVCACQLKRLHSVTCDRLELNRDASELSTASFRAPRSGPQRELFGTG